MTTQIPDNTCFRCGTCCCEMMATVPKYETSDLSPDKEFDSYEAESEYMEQNCEFQGKKCKWLDDSTVETTCLAYERRGDDCRNYPGKSCKVGPLVLLKKHLQGEKLPDALMARLKELPLYDYYLKTAEESILLLQQLSMHK